jgi:hypothetical protein
MGHATKAAIRATVATAIGALLMLVPGLNVILLIAVMLPLWVLSDLGVPGLGSPLHGFFLPSTIGWVLVAVTFWCICHALAVWRLKQAEVRQRGF